MRLITDSSANLTQMPGVDFVSVPLTITLGPRSDSDTPELRVANLLREMDAASGPLGTACPSVGDWLDAFGEAEEIFAVTLTGTLSGCCGAASIAAKEYMEAHPDRKVVVMDSRTTGPELELLAERFGAMAGAGTAFAEACREIRAYRRRTHLGFLLVSLDNFARNGRVSPALAKIVSMLHVSIVGRASADGRLEPLQKCRGQARGLEQLWKNMKSEGYAGGKVRIRHTENAAAAAELRGMILSEYPRADVFVGENRGLCSFYAEHGGLLVGYEGAEAVPPAGQKRRRPNGK